MVEFKMPSAREPGTSVLYVIRCSLILVFLCGVGVCDVNNVGNGRVPSGGENLAEADQGGQQPSGFSQDKQLNNEENQGNEHGKTNSGRVKDVDNVKLNPVPIDDDPNVDVPANPPNHEIVYPSRADVPASPNLPPNANPSRSQEPPRVVHDQQNIPASDSPKEPEFKPQVPVSDSSTKITIEQNVYDEQNQNIRDTENVNDNSQHNSFSHNIESPSHQSSNSKQPQTDENINVKIHIKEQALPSKDSSTQGNKIEFQTDNLEEVRQHRSNDQGDIGDQGKGNLDEAYDAHVDKSSDEKRDNTLKGDIQDRTVDTKVPIHTTDYLKDQFPDKTNLPFVEEPEQNLDQNAGSLSDTDSDAEVEDEMKNGQDSFDFDQDEVSSILTSLPEPFDRTEIAIDSVSEVAVTYGRNLKETSVLFKPDEYGFVRLLKYKQKVGKDGSVITATEEFFEHLPELAIDPESETTKQAKEANRAGLIYEPAHSIPNILPTDHIGDNSEENDLGETTDSTKTEEIYQEPEIPMTEEEILGQKLYEQGELLINSTYNKDYAGAYQFFEQAAMYNHTESQAYLAFGYFLGDYMTQNVTRAHEMFEDLAQRGSPKGQLGLALLYSTGIGVNSSQAKSLIYFTFAALGGEPQAQMALGFRYWSSIGVEMKCETALTYYRKVASKVADEVSLSGGPIIQKIRLQEAEEDQNQNSGLLDEDLLQYYHFLADKGDVQAQVVVGQLCFQGGRGVTINHELAFHYFLMAAESGNANALAYLGKMYAEGSPAVKANNMTALNYFKKSADKNNPIGQSGLGTMYLYGKGVDKDYNKAFKYFSLAADQGWVDGQLQLGIMYFNGLGVRRDYKMAVKYFNLASQLGHVLAFYNLAQMHATGTGVPQSCHTAVEFFKNVAERGRWADMVMAAHSAYKDGNVDAAVLKYIVLAELGYEVAQSNVAYILDQGESFLFDHDGTYKRALLQWSRAAAQGYPVARVKIGDYHYYGYGTEVDYEMAASHYRVASEQQHNAQAMFNLGYMHERGLGLKQDIHLAKRFYDMAADTSVDAQVPVTLALIKLGLFYGLEVFNKEFESYQMLLLRLDPRLYLGPDWDLYLLTALVASLALVVVWRRHR